MVEERYSDKLRSLDPVFGEDGQYFMKTSTGDSNVCMNPRLRKWISEQLKIDAAVMKERRKAREERVLVRAPPGGSSGDKGSGKKKS